MKRLTLLLFLPLLVNAQNINRVEYYFDVDPGPGNGLPVSFTQAPNISFPFTVPLTSVSEGFHLIYFRARSSGKWSLPVSQPVFVERAAQTATVSVINRIEYFLDSDPGPGNGIQILVSPSINISHGFTIPLSTTPEGFHIIYFRAKNAARFWSHPIARPVFVQRNAQTASSPALTEVEYFFDVDPGMGNGTSIPLSASAIDQSIIVNLSSVSAGFHVLFMRSRDANGRWGLLTARPFVAQFSGNIIEAVEYFFTDGTTTSPILSFAAFTPGNDVTVDFAANLSALVPSTAYEIHLVGINARGQRSEIATLAFTTPAIICDPLSTPTTTGDDLCDNGSLTLQASGAAVGQSYLWYPSASGGNPISGETGSTFSTPVLTSTTIYYAVILNGTCESARAPVTATILNCGLPPYIHSIVATTPAGSTLVVPLLPIIFDMDNDLDTASVQVLVPPISGAAASVTDGVLTINYAGVNFTGSDNLTIQACDAFGSCTQQVIYINVVGDVVVYNALSPNGDGKNDQLVIQNIELFPQTKKNKLTIFNRWGDIVFEAVDYDNVTNVFKGQNSEGGELQTGTYYYTIEFPSGEPRRTGFISLRR